MEYICSNINCKKIFPYPSYLKKHLTNSYHCNKTITDIDKYIKDIIDNNKLIANDTTNIIEALKCKFCKKTYVNNFTLTRHLKESKCSKNKEQIERDKQIAILQKQIDDLKNQNSIPLQQPVTTPVPAQQIQIINHNERIINNNLTINNTIVQHIYPLGYEKLPNISQEEMIRLLELGDKGVIEIVKLVCEQDENKNFYKINLNKNNISYLSNQYKIDI